MSSVRQAVLRPQAAHQAGARGTQGQGDTIFCCALKDILPKYGAGDKTVQNIKPCRGPMEVLEPYNIVPYLSYCVTYCAS